MKLKILTLTILLSLLLGLAGCGKQPTATPTSAAQPTATDKPTQAPTDTPVSKATPTDVPSPTATPTPEPTATPTPEPTPEPTPAAAYEEARCPFELPEGLRDGRDVECGYLVVPEDRSDPESPEIRLAVAKFLHPDGDPEADPIIYLEGGPGGSALELLYLSFDRIEPVFDANRDIIMFDQRGVGLSEPALDCPEVVELSLEIMDAEIDGQKLNEEEIHDLFVEAIVACGQDLAEIADLSAYNTAANAADVSDLRAALGYEQVNLWGVSYGTRLALEVMRNHPEGIRSVVLDSVYTPDVDLYLEAPVNADRAFDLLFESCEADEACNAAFPDLRQVLFDTVDRLNETPAEVEITNMLTRETYDSLLTGDDVLGLLFQFLYHNEILPLLPQIIYDASQGEYGTIVLIAGSLLAQQEVMSQGMQLSVQCNEEQAFSTLEELEAVLAEYPELEGLFDDSVLGTMGYEICPEWDSGLADSSENEAVVSDIPTLIMAGEYDPITPPRWGRHAAETLANSYFFEYPGIGHGASLSDECPVEMMNDFLNDPSVAPDDACIAEMASVQFETPGAGAAEIELESFTSDEYGITGLAPAGWEEIAPGIRSRNKSSLDVALIATQAAPVDADTLLTLLIGQFGLEETPEPVGQREANDLTWTLYSIKVQGIPVDMALTDSDGLALVVLLQSSATERDILYEAVFLPVVDALVPTE